MTLSITLVVLLVISAFFSGAETAMMAVNRYRLRHRARQGDQPSTHILRLLARTDRLLGAILLGNTFASVLASALMTFLAMHYFNKVGLILTPIVLTFVILIVSETAPKNYAAVHPERVAKRSVGLLDRFLKAFSPLVSVVNATAKAWLRLFRVKLPERESDSLSAEELSQVVRDASPSINPVYQAMLLRVLELKAVTVDDVLIPMSSIVGIDLSQSIDDITSMMLSHRHRYWPAYRDHINNAVGIVCVHDVLRALLKGPLSMTALLSLMQDVAYIPEGTPVSKQLQIFQANQADVGLVVDEYGDILGLVTMQDIVEEIVGDFAGQHATPARKIHHAEDGSLVVDGSLSIRDFNRLTPYHLPLDGPKTVSGFLINQLEILPSGVFSLKHNDVIFEVLSLDENRVSEVKVSG